MANEAKDLRISADDTSRATRSATSALPCTRSLCQTLANLRAAIVAEVDLDACGDRLGQALNAADEVLATCRVDSAASASQ
jgi:hypothetical protein